MRQVEFTGEAIPATIASHAQSSIGAGLSQVRAYGNVPMVRSVIAAWPLYCWAIISYHSRMRGRYVSSLFDMWGRTCESPAPMNQKNRDLQNREQLKPTLWRTCRVLANMYRLKILRALMSKPGQSVTSVAASLDLDISLTSRYMRELNARGLLKAKRKGASVTYWPHADSSVPQAHALLESLQDAIENRPDPLDSIFRAATAFTHPRRIAIVKELSKRPLRFSEVKRSIGMSKTATKRQLRKLVDRGFARLDDTCGFYMVPKLVPSVERTLLALACND